MNTLQKMKSGRLTAGTMMASVLAAHLMTAAPVEAGWPRVFAHIPAESQAVLCTNSLSEFTTHLDALKAAVAIPAMEMVSPEQMLMMHGFNLEMIDADESWGIAKVGIESPEEMGDLIVFVPVTDYDGFIGGFVNEKNDGLDFLTMPNGESMWCRSVAGYALLSENEIAVREYAPDPNSSERWQKAAGRYGEEILARGDIALIVDVEGGVDLWEDLMQDFPNNADFQRVGGDIEQFEHATEVFKELGMESGAFGLRFSSEGVAMDMAFQGAPEGTMAKFFPGSGEPVNALNRLPNDPFLYAVTLDMQAINMPAIMDMMKSHLAEAEEQGMMPEDMPFSVSTLMEKSMKFAEAAEGYAAAVYPSPMGIMAGGLLMNSAVVYSGDTEELQAACAAMMEGMSFKNEDGYGVAVDYEKGALDIDEAHVDQFSVSVNLPAESMQAQMQINQMFGPKGIRGYVIPGDHGIAVTFSQNRALASKVLATMRGEQGLATNMGLHQLDSLFWTKESGGVYLGVGTIAQQVAPMMAMMGLPGLDVQALGALPPVGMRSYVEDGSVVCTIAIPAPVIKTVGEIATQIEMMQNQPDFDADTGGDDEEDLF